MPRRLRIEFEGAIYHVMARANARQKNVRIERLGRVARPIASRQRAQSDALAPSKPEELAGTVG